jgi:hypothetical protein
MAKEENLAGEIIRNTFNPQKKGCCKHTAKNMGTETSHFSGIYLHRFLPCPDSPEDWDSSKF